jgi:hypothetical protein
MESGVAKITLLQRHYNWPFKIESNSKSHRDFVLLPAHRICSAAKTTNFKINIVGTF